MGYFHEADYRHCFESRRQKAVYIGISRGRFPEKISKIERLLEILPFPRSKDQNAKDIKGCKQKNVFNFHLIRTPHSNSVPSLYLTHSRS